MKEVLTTKEVAEKLRVSEQMVYKAARSGQIPSFKFGRRVLFNADKIEKFIEEGG